ncbi:SRPBCC domain-containing protein [Streptomyces sp. H27-C3]|uniref:SRPBCC domain-containing protein n=1 Tax=Streptomyces sp. H27-C3 TaxID=3046305 RepID=UPI0024BA4665|nr:SRPBCC domain-containing protein [Streptomyces sp. H27-C3]MDJ0466772.1 SRPBCC domain-containing protein [Streptomyces sp. H27-C3]
MEHEVFVPVPAETLRQTLGDPARVARCVPGLQQDADEASGPLSGRLKIRIGGHTITYRGTLRVTELPDGSFAVEGEGAEARGTGLVKLALTLRLTPTAVGGVGADGVAGAGTGLTFTGTASGEGRIAELDAAATLASAHRLLDRFAARLAADPGEAGPEPVNPSGTAGAAGTDESAGATGATDPADPADFGGDDDVPAPDAGVPAPADDHTSAFGTEVPPPSLDPVSDLPGVPAPAGPPAVEAAHARRTMIGRSAEEVDHAPPRGRYAPVPSPQSSSATATLRWVAPAAALALASAVVVGRALRRRQ